MSFYFNYYITSYNPYHICYNGFIIFIESSKAKRNEPGNVHGWAVKLQYSLWCAMKEHGIKEYPLLEKFSENDMTEFLEYLDWVETDIRKTLYKNNAHLNEFATVDQFIKAYEQEKIRK